MSRFPHNCREKQLGTRDSLNFLRRMTLYLKFKWHIIILQPQKGIQKRGQHCEDGVPAYSLQGWTGVSVAAELRSGPLYSGFMPTESSGINLKCLMEVLPSQG